jgi:hypothetical protein
MRLPLPRKVGVKRRSKSKPPRSTGSTADRERSSGAARASSARPGSSAGWSDEGASDWTDEVPGVETIEIPESTKQRGSASAARRRLEQYLEDRRLRDLLKDVFEESDDE